MEESSIFPSSPLRFEADLASPREENEKSSDFSQLLFGANSDSAGPHEENIETSEFPSTFIERKSEFVGAGLRNIGNTCYLNSVLQCMMHTVPFVERLQSFDHCHPKSEDDSYFCSLCSLKRLVDSCMSNTGWSESPDEFTSNLEKISSDFCLEDQQDAHEFLLCLLDNLHNCCLDPSSKGQPSSMDKDSLVKHVYGGCSISQLRCSECGHCSNTLEPLLDLSLEIAEAETLTDALKSFTKVEKIDETKFVCDGCKFEVLMEKQTKIEQAPAVISLHLKRFRNDGQFVNKIDKFVEYPLELDLRPFISCPKDEEQTIYELYAVLVHQGGAHFGHYYCYVRSSPTTWHSMDDSMVRRIPETTTVLKEMAYILFYIKQGSSPWFSSLLDSRNAKITLPIFDTSPISVLDHRAHSLSSADETSNNSSRVTPENEEPGPCPPVFPEPVTAHPECDHSSSPSHTCDSSNHQKRPCKAVKISSRVQHPKRPNPDHCVISRDNVFHDEPLEDEKESYPIPQVNGGRKGNKEVGRTILKPTLHACCVSEPIKRLMRAMPSYRRSDILSCLPPEGKVVSEMSPLILKTHSFNKKRRAIFSDRLPSNAEKGQQLRPIPGASSPMPSSRSLSPSAFKRGLFGDDM